VNIKPPLLMAACRFVACSAVCMVMGIAVADDASIPIPPKVTKIKYVSPVFFSTNDPNITVMANDPGVTQQRNKMVKLTINPTSASAGNTVNSGQLGASLNAVNVETITFPVKPVLVKISNTASNFLFVDITSRNDVSKSSQLLTMSDESRRLQIEAARQMAYKAKRNN